MSFTYCRLSRAIFSAISKTCATPRKIHIGYRNQQNLQINPELINQVRKVSLKHKITVKIVIFEIISFLD